SLYYYGEATMKQIGAAIGVNESRVSQLHARAMQRLRRSLGADAGVLPAVVPFQHVGPRRRMAQVALPQNAVVLQYRPPMEDAQPVRRPIRGRVALAR